MKYFERYQSYKYELTEDEVYPVPSIIGRFTLTPFILLEGKEITIKAGYAWDGSSIPLKRIARFVTFGKYDPDKYCKEASLVHDAFYQLMRSGLLAMCYKTIVDRLYEHMCIAGATTTILADKAKAVELIMASSCSKRKKRGRLIKLDNKKDSQINRLPAWAARRYWAVKHFGARTLKPRHYPEKTILDTNN